VSDLRHDFDERARQQISIETLILEIAEKSKLLERELSMFRLQSQSALLTTSSPVPKQSTA